MVTGTWRDPVRTLVEEVRKTWSLSGLVVAVARGGDAPEYLIVGSDPAGRPLAEDSLFPVASITKLATALGVLRLVAAGKLAIDDLLEAHLPDAAAARDGVTIRRLLSHTAGLPDDIGPGLVDYAPGLDWPALGRACLATAPAEPPGRRVLYSNLGPGLLAVLVERITGRSFPDAVRDLVLDPLGIEGYLGTEPPRPVVPIAGDLGEHAGTALEPFNSAFWRSLGFPWGGLMTTPGGALALTRAFAGQPAGFLPPNRLAEATRDQTGGLGGGFWEPLIWPVCPWGLGAELRGRKDPHWIAAEASPESFGHAGASGCVAWADPVADLAWAILAPRFFLDWWVDLAPISRAVLAARGCRRTVDRPGRPWWGGPVDRSARCQSGVGG